MSAPPEFAHERRAPRPHTEAPPEVPSTHHGTDDRFEPTPGIGQDSGHRPPVALLMWLRGCRKRRHAAAYRLLPLDGRLAGDGIRGRDPLVNRTARGGSA